MKYPKTWLPILSYLNYFSPTHQSPSAPSPPNSNPQNQPESLYQNDRYDIDNSKIYNLKKSVADQYPITLAVRIKIQDDCNNYFSEEMVREFETHYTSQTENLIYEFVKTKDNTEIEIQRKYEDEELGVSGGPALASLVPKKKADFTDRKISISPVEPLSQKISQLTNDDYSEEEYYAAAGSDINNGNNGDSQYLYNSYEINQDYDDDFTSPIYYRFKVTPLKTIMTNIQCRPSKNNNNNFNFNDNDKQYFNFDNLFQNSDSQDTNNLQQQNHELVIDLEIYLNDYFKTDDLKYEQFTGTRYGQFATKEKIISKSSLYLEKIDLEYLAQQLNVDLVEFTPSELRIINQGDIEILIDILDDTVLDRGKVNYGIILTTVLLLVGGFVGLMLLRNKLGWFRKGGKNGRGEDSEDQSLHHFSAGSPVSST